MARPYFRLTGLNWDCFCWVRIIFALSIIPYSVKVQYRFCFFLGSLMRATREQRSISIHLNSKMRNLNNGATVVRCVERCRVLRVRVRAQANVNAAWRHHRWWRHRHANQRTGETLLAQLLLAASGGSTPRMNSNGVNEAWINVNRGHVAVVTHRHTCVSVCLPIESSVRWPS